MMDQILEHFDNLEKVKEDKKKSLEVKSMEPKKSRNKTVLGTNGKGRGRGRGRGSGR